MQSTQGQQGQGPPNPDELSLAYQLQMQQQHGNMVNQFLQCPAQEQIVLLLTLHNQAIETAEQEQAKQRQVATEFWKWYRLLVSNQGPLVPQTSALTN